MFLVGSTKNNIDNDRQTAALNDQTHDIGKSMVFSKIIKNILAVCSGDIVSKGLAIVSTVILIRMLDQQDYGLYTNFIAVMSFIAAVIGSGMNIAATRYSTAYLSIHRKNPQSIYLINLAIQILLYIPVGTLLLFYPSTISRVFFGTEVYSIAVMLGGIASIGVIIIQLAASIFQSSQDFKNYVVLLMLRQFVILCAISLLAILSYGNFLEVSLAISATQIILGAIILFYLKDWLRVTSFKLQILRDLQNSGGMLTLYFFFLSLFGQLDIFMLSRFRTPEEIAVYGVAFRYYSLALMALPSIHVVLLPEFSRLAFASRQNQLDFLFKWLRVSSLSIVPICLTALFAEPIFEILNGKSYLASIPLFRVFCIGIFISLVFSPLVNILIANNHHRFLVKLSIVVLGLNFLGHYYFTSKYGIMAASIVTVASSGIMNISTFLKVYFGTILPETTHYAEMESLEDRNIANDVVATTEPR
jgi:O-antigen/teichoic acid export membrane protein